jgi:tetratricopeptide (TPR) repeat protein
LPALLLPVANELPFSGRDAERDALREQWKSASTDGRTVTLISGEPGVGKTRLTSELARAAHEDGAWVLAGRCDENISAPFAPWIEILRHVLAHAPTELLTAHVDRHGGELTRLVPELARRVDKVPAPRTLDPETEQLALFDAAVDLIDAIAADAAALVVIDDAHWADGSSLGLLRHLVRRLPPTSAVLVIVTYRDTDVDRAHPLSAMIGDFRREPRVEHYGLRGIDEAGMRALLTSAGGAELDDLGRQFASTLGRETEGNPFFVGEVLRHLIETNVLVQRDGRWEGTVTSIEEVGIPEGVRDVVGRRLSRLPDDANATLRTAAVVGREFPVDLVAEIADVPEDVVLEHVELAIGARLVDEVSDAPGTMTFSHALVRSTLIEELSTTRRVRLHRQIAEALEARGRSSAAELAHHFSEAAATGVADKALEHAVRAAEEATNRLAYEEAVRFYDLALDALEAGDDDATRAKLLIGRGLAQHERGDPESGRADGLAAAAAARRISDAALVGRAGIAYQGMVGHWATPHDPVAVELMREGLAALGPDDDETRAAVMAALANALVLVPGDEALRLAEEAEALARATGEEIARATALRGWAWALRSRGRSGELRRVASLALEHALEHQQSSWEFNARYLYAEGLIEAGEIEAAIEEIDIAGSIPSVLQGWAPVVLASSVAHAEGRLDDAERLVHEAAALGSALGDTNDAIHSGEMTVVEMARGRTAEALGWVERAEATLLGQTLNYRSFVLVEAGELKEAATLHARWAREVRPFAPQVVMPWILESETSVAYRCADSALAESLRDQVAPFEGHILGGDTALLGTGEYLMGRIAFVEGRFDDAVDLGARAVEIETGHGWSLRATNHRIDLARALLARDGPGDADQARALLAEAIDTGDRLGLVAAATEARTLITIT